MRVVIQRVSKASVKVESRITGQIQTGLLVLAGFEAADTAEDLEWVARKIAGLRIFSDTEGQMNLSLDQVNGKILLISQFTLHAATKKGNRPSFIKAAKPELAIPLYEQFKKMLEITTSTKVETGIFGADMQVELLNNGPVTLFIDSKNRE